MASSGQEHIHMNSSLQALNWRLQCSGQLPCLNLTGTNFKSLQGQLQAWLMFSLFMLSPFSYIFGVVPESHSTSLPPIHPNIQCCIVWATDS